LAIQRDGLQPWSTLLLRLPLPSVVLAIVLGVITGPQVLGLVVHPGLTLNSALASECCS
jgi:Kef-type K+ transport system membrane component KefB